MKKEIIIALFLTLGVLLAVAATFITGLFICSLFTEDDFTFYTENIEDYDSEEFPIPRHYIFLDEIPENATVVRFSHYHFYNHEDEDVYLELKFETKEEMDEYLSAIKQYCKENFNSKLYNTTNPFIEVQNIYDEKFVDLFCRDVCLITSDKRFTGYESHLYTNDKDDFDIKCHFAVISYSYDDLTVIQSYSSGTFFEWENEYTPQYLVRFSVPLDEKIERYYNVIAED